jgi:hypothetical protein
MAVSISRSAKLFQERRIPGDRVTRRLPAPRSSLSDSKIHQIPLQPPYPSPDVIRSEGGLPPDGGLTQTWPYGEEVITV